MRLIIALFLLCSVVSCGGDTETQETGKKKVVSKKPVTKKQANKKKIDKKQASKKKTKKVVEKKSTKKKVTKTASGVKENLDTRWGKISYCLGLQLGDGLRSGKFDYDKNKIKDGFKLGFSGGKLSYGTPEIEKIKNDFQAEMSQRQLNKDYIPNRDKATKYFIVTGYEFVSNFKKDGLFIDGAMYFSGFDDGIDKVEPKLEHSEMATVMRSFQKEMTDKLVAENTKEGREYLAKKKKEKGIKVTKSGLAYKVIKKGNGKTPTASDKVTVHYAGTFVDGTEFDSSYQRGEPASFGVTGVIKGWTEALQLMKEGDVFELYIPHELAYGENGGRGMPPCATLVFKVELIKVN